MFSILARRVSVSKWSVAVRTVGELNRLVRGIADGELSRVGIIDYNRVATAPEVWLVTWKVSGSDETYSTTSRES